MSSNSNYVITVSFFFFLSFSPVGSGWRKRRLHLCRGLRSREWVLGNVEYSFVDITPRFTLTRNAWTCLGLIYKSSIYTEIPRTFQTVTSLAPVKLGELIFDDFIFKYAHGVNSYPPYIQGTHGGSLTSVQRYSPCILQI